MLPATGASKAEAKFASVPPLPAVDIPLNPPCINTLVNKSDPDILPKLASLELFQITFT